MNTEKHSTVDAYIASFPKNVQVNLEQIRQIIKKNASDTEEKISYNMPGYKLNKRPLVYFAAYKNHIGFYATPSGNTEFAEELSKYQRGKGSIQFQYDEPLPLNLIEKIVKFRVRENLAK